MSRTEQVRPLAMASPDPAILEEGNRDDGPKWQSDLQKRRVMLCCLGCCTLVLVLLALVVLVLALVFHIKNPTLSMNSIRVDGLSSVTNSSRSSPSSINVTLTADISMKNPNNAAFRFGNSTIQFRDSAGRVVGVGPTPAGKVGTDRSLRLNLTVIVHTTSEAVKPRAGPNGTTTVVELSGYSEVEGTVNVLGVYKRHKIMVLDCNFDVDMSLSDQVINKPDCRSATK